MQRMKAPQRVAVEKELLREELEKTRSAYHALLADVPVSAYEWPTSNPAWNVRQLLFHIIVAGRFLPQDISMLRSGRFVTPPAWLFNILNVWYTRWGARGQTPRSLAETYDAVHEKVMALLNEIGDEEWDRSAVYPGIDPNLSGEQSIADLFHYLSVHFDEHEHELRLAVSDV